MYVLVSHKILYTVLLYKNNIIKTQNAHLKLVEWLFLMHVTQIKSLEFLFYYVIIFKNTTVFYFYFECNNLFGLVKCS